MPSSCSIEKPLNDRLEQMQNSIDELRRLILAQRPSVPSFAPMWPPPLPPPPASSSLSFPTPSSPTPSSPPPKLHSLPSPAPPPPPAPSTSPPPSSSPQPRWGSRTDATVANNSVMRKSATVEKQARRSSIVVVGGGGRGTPDGQLKKPVKETDVFQLFADKLSDMLETRLAILQGTKIEYFTGKDFAAFLMDHPRIKKLLGPDADMGVEEIANTLLSKNLLVRCRRVVKTVTLLDGNLSPNEHLDICPDQVFTENDGFFAWAIMKRVTIWPLILSFLCPLIALAMLLFPVCPCQCKIVVLYPCAGALLFIVSLLILRGAIFGALYVILGESVWFFPNINGEEATFREVIRFWPKKEEGAPPKLTSRLTYAIAAVLVILILCHHAPGEDARLRYLKEAYNIMDDVCQWSPPLDG